MLCADSKEEPPKLTDNRGRCRGRRRDKGTATTGARERRPGGRALRDRRARRPPQPGLVLPRVASRTSGAGSSARSQGGRHGARWARLQPRPTKPAGEPPGRPGEARPGPGAGGRRARTGDGESEEAGPDHSGPAPPQKENNKLPQHGRRLARRRGARRDDGGRVAPVRALPSEAAAPPSRLRRTQTECGKQTGRRPPSSAPETLTFKAGEVAGRSSLPGSVVSALRQLAPCFTAGVSPVGSGSE